MRWIALIFSILAAFGCIKGFARYDSAYLAMPQLAEPLSLLGFSSICAIFFVVATRAAKRTARFEQWLQLNAESVLQQGATYEGAEINRHTEVRRFLVAFSVIAASFKIPTRHHIAGLDNLVYKQIQYSFVTLVCGWWGFPWGPVYTVQSLAKNASGGYIITIEEYLTELQRR
jgi:hypothetical protein